MVILSMICMYHHGLGLLRVEDDYMLQLKIKKFQRVMEKKELLDFENRYEI